MTYYLDDVERVRQLISQEFRVDEQHSVDKITHLGAEEFGYRSVHLIIAVSEPRVSRSPGMMGLRKKWNKTT